MYEKLAAVEYKAGRDPVELFLTAEIIAAEMEAKGGGVSEEAVTVKLMPRMLRE